jgi:hypothetical protein
MRQRSGLFWDAPQGRAQLRGEAAIPGLKKEPPHVTGELTTDPAALSATADDFGHIEGYSGGCVEVQGDYS